MEEVSSLVKFANSFHPTINFSYEMSSERDVVLDTEVFKGPRLSTLRILDSQTPLQAYWNFPVYTISSFHPFHTKKGFFQRTNSVKENFYNYKRDFEQRLCNRGYPTALVHKILTEVQLSERTETKKQTKKEREIFDMLSSNSSVLFLFCRKKSWMHKIHDLSEMAAEFYATPHFWVHKKVWPPPHLHQPNVNPSNKWPVPKHSTSAPLIKLPVKVHMTRKISHSKNTPI